MRFQEEWFNEMFKKGTKREIEMIFSDKAIEKVEGTKFTWIEM